MDPFGLMDLFEGARLQDTGKHKIHFEMIASGFLLTVGLVMENRNQWRAVGKGESCTVNVKTAEDSQVRLYCDQVYLYHKKDNTISLKDIDQVLWTTHTHTHSDTHKTVLPQQ